MNRQGHFFFAAGCIASLAAVLLGAMGAHLLRPHLDPALTGTYQVAASYHFYHALGLLAVGLSGAHCRRQALLRWAGLLMMAGLVLFSGSLYVLAATGIRSLGAVTPFGGVAWIAAWALLAIAMWPVSAQRPPESAPRSA